LTRKSIATGALGPGDWLPTVRQLSHLSVNPNTAGLQRVGAHWPRGDPHGSGTFIGWAGGARRGRAARILDQICQEFLSRASAHGFTLEDILDNLKQRQSR
jgi:DNA-binding transcriptional regulator YhcF (GntR family)